MKKLLFYIFLVFAFTITSLNAETPKKTNEELIQQIMKMNKESKESKQKIKKSKAKTLAIEEELKSAIKVNKKLDEIKGILSK